VRAPEEDISSDNTGVTTNRKAALARVCVCVCAPRNNSWSGRNTNGSEREGEARAGQVEGEG